VGFFLLLSMCFHVSSLSIVFFYCSFLDFFFFFDGRVCLEYEFWTLNTTCSPGSPGDVYNSDR